MDWYRLLEIAGGAILASGIALLGAYWKGYAAWKAKYDADKEDIGIITEIQEAVKIEFQKQVTTLTAQLQVKNKINEELRNAIYEYNSNLHDLAENVAGYPFAPFNDFGKFSDKYDAYKKSLSKLILLLSDQDFYKLEYEFDSNLHQMRTIQVRYKNYERNLEQQIARADVTGDNNAVDLLREDLVNRRTQYIQEHQPIQSEIGQNVAELRRLLSLQFQYA